MSWKSCGFFNLFKVAKELIGVDLINLRDSGLHAAYLFVYIDKVLLQRDIFVKRRFNCSYSFEGSNTFKEYLGVFLHGFVLKKRRWDVLLSDEFFSLIHFNIVNEWSYFCDWGILLNRFLIHKIRLDLLLFDFEC